MERMARMRSARCMRSINQRGLSIKGLPPIAIMLLAGSWALGQTPAAIAPPYAGSDTCATCHEDISTAFKKSPHAAVESNKRRGFQGRACESCHGPALKHSESAAAEDIKNPAKLTAVAADKICMGCHLNEPTHVGRLQSSHAKDQVACTGCHKVHANGPFGMVERRSAAITAQCEGCHLSAKAQFQQPFHHKVPEGAMNCVDCHNPHGGLKQGMQQIFAANETGCIKCHSDTRGPFQFEHAPVRFEGCGACHAPHGSSNPKMLIRAEVRLLCLECHAVTPQNAATSKVAGILPPSFHDLRSPRYQNCTTCHQKIHGSHVDRNLLR